MTANAKNPRPYHHGDLKAVLLQAAEAELNEKGVETFSLRQVAKRAGVSHAAPAHHFSDVTELLTALSTIGYKRFIEFQNARQKASDSGAIEQLIALGLGYIDFALAHPAVFRLMFTSEKTDRGNSALTTAMSAAFDKLATDTERITGRNPYTDEKGLTDVIAAWSMVQGLADLLISDRLGFLLDMSPAKREKIIRNIIARSVIL